MLESKREVQIPEGSFAALKMMVNKEICKLRGCESLSNPTDNRPIDC